ncbi:ABC transporter substrate-binding protein [uncultured Clostridium sp.]|uniref:ABC transporter substrate-binding protein n=1 Tax=uncultured Clostridium sp. TaxID=59620 RepID=UPI0026124865|nr:ABC transporter substrate-binding protein [uncultured Clostridium sp.]
MKEKIKIVVIIAIIIIASVVMINMFEANHGEKISGKLEIWVNSSEYNYINTVAESFKEKHKDVNIDIKEINSKDYYNDVINSVKDKEQPDIAILNSDELYNLVNKEKIYPVDLGGTISTYSMNFGKNRLEQVHFDKKYYGVPLTSSPLVLYARNDLLSQYGISNNDLNTWNDVITVGEKIFKDSNGKVKLLSGIGPDYKKLEELILLENMKKNLTEQEVLNNTNNMLEELKKDNIIALNGNEEYAAKIGSISQMKELQAIKEKCEWTANNPPSLVVGSNKFYEGIGENLVTLKEENKRLSEAFIAYLSNDTKVSLEYTLSGNMFSSYLYTYKDVQIEDKINNFSGKSPLVIMSNIEKNAPLVENYDVYMEAREKLLGN